MLVPSLMTFGIASVATFLSINSKEEIVKVTMAFTAVFSLLLTLYFAPWIVKLIVLIVPLVWGKLSY